MNISLLAIKYNLFYSRISLIENQATNHLFLTKKFSSKFIFLLWAVCGGFMMYIHYLINRMNDFLIFSHFLLCNLLTTILRPNFEEPIDTAKQLVEKNITLFVNRGGEIWKQFLQKSTVDEYKIIGDNMIIADNWDHFDNLTEHDVIGAGTHAWMGSSLLSYKLALGKWHRSQETLAGDYPFGGYLTNKKWPLNEVNITTHVYTFCILINSSYSQQTN